MIIGHEVCVVPQEILFRLFITAEDVLNKDNVHQSNKKVQLCFIFLTFHCDFYKPGRKCNWSISNGNEQTATKMYFARPFHWLFPSNNTNMRP